MLKHYGYNLINSTDFNPQILYIQKETITEPSETYMYSEFLTVICILEGICTYIVNGTPYIAKKGDIILCNPTDFHKKIPHEGEPVIEINMGVTDFTFSNLPRNSLISENKSRKITLKTEKENFLNTCNELLLEETDCEYASLLLKAISTKLLALIIKEIYSGKPNAKTAHMKIFSSDKKGIIQAIVEFLENNYMDDISLETISKNMYLSSVYISKLFKDEMGESPINHLIKIRLKKAKELLETENISVKSAAERVGYNDAYYFSKLFKKYYGHSPSQFTSPKNNLRK